MRFGVSYLGENERDIHDICLDFDYIVLPFSEATMMWNAEQTRELIEAAHMRDRKVYLDPWGVAGIFGGEALSNWLLHNTDAWQRTSKGRRVPHACLDHLSTRQFIAGWLKRAASLKPDGILWDEPHTWNSAWGYDAGEASCCNENSIQAFISFIDMQMKSYPELESRIVLTPENFHLAGGIEFDSVGVDPYWVGHPDGFDHVKNTLDSITEPVDSLWVQAYNIPKGREMSVMKSTYQALYHAIDDVAFWTYRGGYPSNLRSDCPEEVWKAVLETVRTFK